MEKKKSKKEKKERKEIIMNKFLLTMMGPMIQNVISELLNEDNIRAYGDKLFDFIEDAVADSATSIDDIAVLPIVATLRKSLNIPDND